jgi:uncharacterized Zn-finger protein
MEADTEARIKICKHCGAEFNTKGKYNAHYRRDHQNKMGTEDLNITRRADNKKFKCVCDKEYDLYQSLKRHQQSCLTWQNREMTSERVELSSESEDEGSNQERQ